MTNQEAFNIVLFALRQQGDACIVPGTQFSEQPTCLYRGPEGCKCAIGHLMPDAVYDPRMEGRGLPVLLNQAAASQALRDAFANLKPSLLDELQWAHDRILAVQGPRAWEERMKYLAALNSLDYTPLGLDYIPSRAQ